MRPAKSSALCRQRVPITKHFFVYTVKIISASTQRMIPDNENYTNSSIVVSDASTFKTRQMLGYVQ